MKANLILAAGLATTAAMPALAASPTPIMTVNPGFMDLDNDGAFGDDWATFGAAAVDFSFFGDHNPGHATLYGDVVGNSGGVFQLGIPCTPGKTYEMNVKIQWEVEWDAATYIALEFYAADDTTLISEETVEIVDELVDAGYRRYDVVATAPAGAAFVRPIVRYDDVQSSGASRAATVDNIFISEQDEILNLNPNFDDLVGDEFFGDGWPFWGAVWFGDWFGVGTSGHANLYGDMPGNFGGVYQAGIPAIPGESYTMSVDIQFEANWDAVTVLQLEFFGADDGFMVGEEVMEITEQPGAGYVTYTLEATAPLGFTSYVRPIVEFYEANPGPDQSSATVDNLVVQLTSTLSQGCNVADLAEPFDQLTFADISSFLGAFTTSDPAADLAAPIGQFTFADISAFLAAFAAGCP